jgi:hypothetical protein
MNRRRFACFVCTVSLFALAGCGGAPSVSGTVTFEGAPVDGGTITFTPEQGGTVTARGAQITEGKYVIKSENGLAPGKYKVEIVWNKKTGKTVPNPNDTGTTVDETKQVIPNKYNSRTELTAEIKSGSNSLDFDLKPGGPVDSGKPGSGNKAKAVGDN